jgi:hypothetical protein
MMFSRRVIKRTGPFFRASAFIGLLALAADTARAAVVDLSTGLDATDTLIIIGNSPDAHWTVDQPAGGIAPARVVTASDADGIYVGSIWAADGPSSSWIAIDASTPNNAPFPFPPYTYYRTFNLAAADVSNASISGVWGIDDGGDLRLNGNLISTLINDYSATTPFSVAAGGGLFVAGLNTLSITMTTSDNAYEAVRLTGALSVPEPSALILAGLGLVGLGIVTLRKKYRRA